MTFGGRDNRGPSIAELQRFIREKITLVFTLSNGEKIVGQLRWFDETAFQIVQDGQHPFTILRSAVLGYQKQNPSSSQAAAAPKRAAVEQDIAAVLAMEKLPDAQADKKAESKDAKPDAGQ